MTRPVMFVDVDTQRDFCLPGGKLFVPDAPAILPNIRALVHRASDRGELLVASADTHDFTAWEFAENGGPFPPHCVKGTEGWLKVQGTLPARSTFVPNLVVDPASMIPQGAASVIFEKEVYSLFANPSAESVLDMLLARRGLGRADVDAIVFGVATDYCVRAAALGLAQRGFSVSVVTDAIAAVDPKTGADALEEMAAAGCQFVTTGSLT